MRPKPKTIFDVKRSDLPRGVPVLKWKKGLYYRENNSGYTHDLMQAGFYTREDAIKYCFHGSKNGYCEVFAMPLWMAIEQNYFDKNKLNGYEQRLNELKKYVGNEKFDTIIF